MPFASVNSTRIFYRLEGQPGKPVLVLSHSIGTDHGMWASQAADLTSALPDSPLRCARPRRFRCAPRRIFHRVAGPRRRRLG